MQVEHGLFNCENTSLPSAVKLKDTAQLVLYFGAKDSLQQCDIYEKLHSLYPNAIIAGCSTGGEIIERDFNEDSCVYAALYFEKSEVKAVSAVLHNPEDSFNVGKKLATELSKKDKLKNIFILSEGLKVHGSDLVSGVNSVVDTTKITVTGGLSGDGLRFEETLVGLNEAPKSGQVVCLGFYGDDLEISWGSYSGFDNFGPERIITKSEGSTLYELDGKPALDLYKKYLGEEANNLPGSAFYFPLAIWPQNEKSEWSVIRTILSIDEKNNSMFFAGDVPQGWKVRLMWGKFDNLVDGAAKSAECAKPQKNDTFSILVSCLGRKALMGQRVVNEIEQSADTLSKEIQNNTRIGFYSYGEIAPHSISKIPVLHNQTMTITTFSEK
jgi:hypothetical protein